MADGSNINNLITISSLIHMFRKPKVRVILSTRPPVAVAACPADGILNGLLLLYRVLQPSSRSSFKVCIASLAAERPVRSLNLDCEPGFKSTVPSPHYTVARGQSWDCETNKSLIYVLYHV